MNVKKIVIADPEKCLLRWEQNLLQRKSFQVYGATTGGEGFELLKEKQAHLMVLDSQLRDIDPIELCRMVREDSQTRGTSLLGLLRREEDGRERLFKEAGCNATLHRPIGRFEFYQRIGFLLQIPTRRFLRTVVKIKVPFRNQGSALFGWTINLSPNGMLLECSEPLASGSILDFLFFLPGMEKHPIRAVGKVVRVAGEVHPDQNAFGVNFFQIAKKDQRLIMEFVDANRVNVRSASPSAPLM